MNVAFRVLSLSLNSLKTYRLVDFVSKIFHFSLFNEKTGFKTGFVFYES